MGEYLNLRTYIGYGLILAFLFNTLGPLPSAQAQDFFLPTPGVRVGLSPQYDPPILKGLKVHPDNPFRFDFILDRGDSSSPVTGEATKLIKYFLASLTIPEKDLWVNLSPYEKDRIIPQGFGLTEMGRDLLAEDYMLKQITASLIYPEGEVGRKFWKRIYEESVKKFGTTDIPVNTFNKVWIVPEKAVVYENAKAGTAYIVESKLKVMLEQDYLALEKNSAVTDGPKQSTSDASTLGSQVVREIVIPELTKEVNEDKNFSQLRQVYNSLILATWYRKKIKDSILSQVYADKNKVAGVNINDPQEKQRIYERYLQAFKKGAYNYIKEEIDPITQQSVPRKYISGGMLLINPQITFTTDTDKAMVSVPKSGVLIEADISPVNKMIMATGNADMATKLFEIRFILNEMRKMAQDIRAGGTTYDAEYMDTFYRDLQRSLSAIEQNKSFKLITFLKAYWDFIKFDPKDFGEGGVWARILSMLEEMEGSIKLQSTLSLVEQEKFAALIKPVDGRAQNTDEALKMIEDQMDQSGVQYTYTEAVPFDQIPSNFEILTSSGPVSPKEVREEVSNNKAVLLSVILGHDEEYLLVRLSDAAMAVDSGKDLTWADVAKEGFSYKIESHDTSILHSKMVHIYLRGRAYSNGILMKIFPKQKIVNIAFLYPNFPQDGQKGRGRALLSELFKVLDLNGYYIMGSFNKYASASLRGMSDVQVDVKKFYFPLEQQIRKMDDSPLKQNLQVVLQASTLYAQIDMKEDQAMLVASEHGAVNISIEGELEHHEKLADRIGEVVNYVLVHNAMPKGVTWSGRSIIISLTQEEQFTVNGKTFKSIRLKGATYQGRAPRMKLYATEEDFTEQPTHSLVVDKMDGQEVIVYEQHSPSPEGTMYLSLAESEYKEGKAIFEAGIPTAMPIGIGEFTTMNFIGDKVGFTILAEENDPVPLRLGEALRKQLQQKRTQTYFDDLGQGALDAARLLRSLNDKGFIHSNPHLAQFDYQDKAGSRRVYDFNDAYDLQDSGISRDEFIYRVMVEFLGFYTSVDGFARLNNMPLEFALRSPLARKAYQNILEGYFSPQELEDIKRINAEDMSPLKLISVISTVLSTSQTRGRALPDMIKEVTNKNVVMAELVRVAGEIYDGKREGKDAAMNAAQKGEVESLLVRSTGLDLSKTIQFSLQAENEPLMIGRDGHQGIESMGYHERTLTHDEVLGLINEVNLGSILGKIKFLPGGLRFKAPFDRVMGELKAAPLEDQPFTVKEVSFLSPVIEPFFANAQTVHARYFLPKINDGKKIPTVTICSFFYQDYFARLLSIYLVSQGVAVLEVGLPLYGKRSSPRTDGMNSVQRYVAADLNPQKLKNFIIQSMADTSVAVRWLASQKQADTSRVVLAGQSMTGAVAMSTYLIDPNVNDVFALVPVVNYAHLLWSRGNRYAPIRELLEKKGVTEQGFNAGMKDFNLDQLAKGNTKNTGTVFFGAVKNDELVPWQDAQSLASILNQPKYFFKAYGIPGLSAHLFGSMIVGVTSRFFETMLDTAQGNGDDRAMTTPVSRRHLLSILAAGVANAMVPQALKAQEQEEGATVVAKETMLTKIGTRNIEIHIADNIRSDYQQPAFVDGDHMFIILDNMRKYVRTVFEWENDDRFLKLRETFGNVDRMTVVRRLFEGTLKHEFIHLFTNPGIPKGASLVDYRIRQEVAGYLGEIITGSYPKKVLNELVVAYRDMQDPVMRGTAKEILTDVLSQLGFIDALASKFPGSLQDARQAAVEQLTSQRYAYIEVLEFLRNLPDAEIQRQARQVYESIYGPLPDLRPYQPLIDSIIRKYESSVISVDRAMNASDVVRIFDFYRGMNGFIPVSYSHSRAVGFFESVMRRPGMASRETPGLMRMSNDGSRSLILFSNKDYAYTGSHDTLIKRAFYSGYSKVDLTKEWISTVLYWNKTGDLDTVFLVAPTMNEPQARYSDKMLAFLGVERDKVPGRESDLRYRQDMHDELIRAARLIREAALKQGIDPSHIRVVISNRYVREFNPQYSNLQALADLPIHQEIQQRSEGRDPAMSTPETFPFSYPYSRAVRFFDFMMKRPGMASKYIPGLIRMSGDASRLLMLFSNRNYEGNQLDHAALLVRAHDSGYLTPPGKKDWMTMVLGWDRTGNLNYITLVPPLMTNPRLQYSEKMLAFLGIARDQVPGSEKNIQYRQGMHDELIHIARLIREAALKKGIDPKLVLVSTADKYIPELKSYLTDLQTLANLPTYQEIEDSARALKADQVVRAAEKKGQNKGAAERKLEKPRNVELERRLEYLLETGRVNSASLEKLSLDQFMAVMNIKGLSRGYVAERLSFYNLRTRDSAANRGGIDMTSDKALSVQSNGQGIRFHIDPAQFKELQNAPGFVPVIINVRPMTDLRQFLTQ